MAWISRYRLHPILKVRAFFIIMNEVQVFEYKGNKVTFDFGGGVMTNATEMARAFGKEPYGWIRLATTKDFLWQLLIEKYPQSGPQNLRNETELGAILTEVGLVKIIQGGTSSLQGTWFNDDITIEFARWLSPAFAIWCNDRIKEYLMNGLKPLSKAEMRMQVFMDMQADISRQSNVIKKQSKRIAALVSQLESEKEAKRERLAIASEVKSGDIEKWLSESGLKGLYKLSDLHRRYYGYCGNNNSAYFTTRKLGNILRKKGYTSIHKRNGTWFII